MSQLHLAGLLVNVRRTGMGLWMGFGAAIAVSWGLGWQWSLGYLDVEIRSAIGL
jgi:hypothetical protein